MVFDTLQVKALEGLLSFTNTVGHQSTGTSSAWRDKERGIGESEMNNLKCHQQPNLTEVYIVFYSSSNHITF